MALYTRFGSEVVLLRPAVKADIKRIEKRRADKQDARDLEQNERFGPRQQLWVGQYTDDRGDVLVVLAHLVADEGWKEIYDTATAKFNELAPA